MKTLYTLLAIALLVSCNNGQSPTNNSAISDTAIHKSATEEKTKRNPVEYTGKQLEGFLDSIGKLPSSLWLNKVGVICDSIFKKPEQPNRVLTNADFEALKTSCKTKTMDVKTARRIFKEINDSSYDGKKYVTYDSITLTYFFFEKKVNEFNEFAVFPGTVETNEEFDLYFFKGNKLISKNSFSNHYNGIKLKHFKDSDGKTIIYYEENLLRGTGVSWYNLYFYIYDGDNLIPILNQLEQSYGTTMAGEGNNHNVFFETSIQKTNPLTIKMVFSHSFIDKGYREQKLIGGSSVVKFKWDEASKTLKGNYENKGISKNQLLTYYIEETLEEELLFINLNYKILKQSITKKDKYKFPAILLYLNKIKNECENKSD